MSAKNSLASESPVIASCVVVEDVQGIRLTYRSGRDIEIQKNKTWMLLTPSQIVALMDGPLQRALITALRRRGAAA